MLNDQEIISRIRRDGLLENHTAENVQNCAYSLRAGSAFEPGTGHERTLEKGEHHWNIGPNEVLIVKTRERVKIAPDLCGSYTPLHTLASKGLMLINASIVEPQYHGNLSCFVVNFSSRPVALAPGDKVAKLTLHELNAAPSYPKPFAVDEAKYDRSLADQASAFSRSFLDVASISDAAAEKARGALRSVVIGGGVFIGILLLWASLEPVLSKWLWEVTGVTSATQRVRDAELNSEMQALKRELDEQAKLTGVVERLGALEQSLNRVEERLDQESQEGHE